MRTTIKIEKDANGFIVTVTGANGIPEAFVYTDYAAMFKGVGETIARFQ